MAVISSMAIRGGWRAPLLAASARLLHEPGFMSIRVPWLRRFARNLNLSGLFSAMGFLPIENELQTRSMLRWAFGVEQLHGPLALNCVFSTQTLTRFGFEGLRTDDLFSQRLFERAERARIKASALLEPHRKEQLHVTRARIGTDLDRIESCLRGGAVFFLTPEGEYTRDGTMLAFRGIWERLSPLARKIYVIGVSYDPFIGRRFSQTVPDCRTR